VTFVPFTAKSAMNWKAGMGEWAAFVEPAADFTGSLNLVTSRRSPYEFAGLTIEMVRWKSKSDPCRFSKGDPRQRRSGITLAIKAAWLAAMTRFEHRVARTSTGYFDGSACR